MSDCASAAKVSDTPGKPAAPLSQGSSPSTSQSVHAFYTFEDGSAYEGHFALSAKGLDERLMYVRHGNGIYVKGNYTYSGEWRDGEMTCGTVSFPSGDCYEGQLVNGLFHGWGRYSWYKQGKYYEGMWVNGLMEGPGTLGYLYRLAGEKTQHGSNVDNNAGLMPFFSGTHATGGTTHYECRGIFGAGEYHKTPALQAVLYDEYMTRYRRDWLGAAVEMLQQLEVALQQNASFSAYVGGGQNITQGDSLTTPSSAVVVVGGGGGKNKNADASGGVSAGISKKKPLISSRVSITGTTHSNKDPLGAGTVGGSSSFVEDDKYLSGSSEYIAEKYVLPPYPSLSDLHADGISRVLTAARGHLETSGNTTATSNTNFSVEVRLPTNEQEAFELSLLDRARLLDAKSVAGRGSGQIIEVVVRTNDATGNIFAGIALVNCNDQIAVPEAAHFRAVALVLPSPHQLKKLR